MIVGLRAIYIHLLNRLDILFWWERVLVALVDYTNVCNTYRDYRLYIRLYKFRHWTDLFTYYSLHRRLLRTNRVSHNKIYHFILWYPLYFQCTIGSWYHVTLEIPHDMDAWYIFWMDKLTCYIHSTLQGTHSHSQGRLTLEKLGGDNLLQLGSAEI